MYKEDVFNYLEKKGILTKVSKRVTFKLSQGMVVTKDGVKTLVSDRTAEICYKIVISGYQDTIFDDIQQEVNLTIYNLLLEDKIALNPSDILSFGFHRKIRKDGTIQYKSVYLDLFTTVRRLLDNYKDGSTNYSIIPIADCVSWDEDGNSHSISNNNTSYRKLIARQWDIDTETADKMQSIISRDDIRDFFFQLKKDLKPAKYSRLCTVFAGLLQSLTGDEIASRNNLSIDSVKKARVELKNLWNQYKCKVELSHKPIYKFGGSSTSTWKTAQRTTLVKIKVPAYKPTTPIIKWEKGHIEKIQKIITAFNQTLTSPKKVNGVYSTLPAKPFLPIPPQPPTDFERRIEKMK